MPTPRKPVIKYAKSSPSTSTSPPRRSKRRLWMIKQQQEQEQDQEQQQQNNNNHSQQQSPIINNNNKEEHSHGDAGDNSSACFSSLPINHRHHYHTRNNSKNNENDNDHSTGSGHHDEKKKVEEVNNGEPCLVVSPSPSKKRQRRSSSRFTPAKIEFLPSMTTTAPPSSSYQVFSVDRSESHDTDVMNHDMIEKKDEESEKSDAKMKNQVCCWFSSSKRVFSQVATERLAYEFLQHSPIDFMQGFLLIHRMTNCFDDLTMIDENVDGVETLSNLYSIVTPYTASNEILMSNNDVFKWYKRLGFQYNERRTKIKCPSFFYDIKNQRKIRQFNKMICDTIHLVLHKFFIESREDLYQKFKHLQKKEFALLSSSMKDSILNQMYQKTLDQCKEDVELNGFKHFHASTSIIEAVIDNTHSVIYLGWCYRDAPNGEDWETADDGTIRKYAVVTAYFCCEPVMVLYDRIEFQVKLVEKIGTEHYCFHWENHEITFEPELQQDHKLQTREDVEKQDRMIEEEKHPNEKLCFSFLPKFGGKQTNASTLFTNIYSDMQKPYWRIFCKLPKINLLFEREIELIKDYLDNYGQEISLHYIIYGLSLLCGRYPDAIKLHLTHLGAFETFSSVVYETCDPGIGRLEETEQKLRRVKQETLEKLQNIWMKKDGKNVNMNTLTLEKLKDRLLKCRRGWENLMDTYKQHATVAVSRIINEESESGDRDDGNGHKLPKSMCAIDFDDDLRFYYKFDDISRGLSRYPVSSINEVDLKLFDSFHYLLETRPEPSIAHIIEKELENDDVRGCKCGHKSKHTSSTDKSKSRSKIRTQSTKKKEEKASEEQNPVTCGLSCECVSRMGGAAYNEEGLLTKRGFNSIFHIFECNDNCKCDPKTCSNRVVQRGLSVKMELFKTELKGWGVRALEDIKRGQFVAEYVGELITEAIAEERGLAYDTKYECSYLFDVRSEDNKYSIDSNRYGNVARWLNHSCSPNMISREVSVDTRNPHLSRIAFFANRNIRCGEELTYNYNYIIKQRLKCHCGTSKCKGWLM